MKLLNKKAYLNIPTLKKSCFIHFTALSLLITFITPTHAEFLFDFEKQDKEEKKQIGDGTKIDWPVIHHLLSAPLKTIPETPRLIKQGQYDLTQLVQAGYKKAENKSNKCLDDKVLMSFFGPLPVANTTTNNKNTTNSVNSVVKTPTIIVPNTQVNKTPKVSPAKCLLTNLQQKQGSAQMNAICNWNLGVESKLGVFQYDAVVHTSEKHLKVEIKKFRLLNSDQKIPFAFDYANFTLKKTNDCIPDSIKKGLSGAGAGLFKLPTK